MMLLAFALYDTKAQFFSSPMFFGARGQALRAMIELGGDLSTTVGRHPADFVLYEIGEFDDQSGALHPLPPRSLGPVQALLPGSPPVRVFGERSNGENAVEHGSPVQSGSVRSDSAE